MVYDEILDYATARSIKFPPICVIGSAGYGMTTLLGSLATKTVSERVGPVFFLRPGKSVLEGDISFASTLFPEKRPIFFVDNASDHVSGLLDAIGQLRATDRAGLFVLGERTNEWRVRGGRIRTREFLLEALSDPEITRLIACLEGHGELGELEHLGPTLRFAAIKEKYDKQLLITLRETTQHNNFNAIIEDEYRGIIDHTAQRMYLTVCCFSQHGAFLRDSLLSDLMKIPLTELYGLTRDATEGVVIFECIDEFTGKYIARARHRTIAAVVWERCGEISTKSSLVNECLSSLNLNYSSDLRAFEQFVRSDRLVDTISTLDGKIQFFETAVRKDPKSAYVRQHYARMFSRSGHPELARAQIEEALSLSDNIRVLYHTYGVVLGDLALSSDSKEGGRKLLVQAEQAFRRCINMYNKDEHGYYNLAILYLRWGQKYPDEETEYIAKCEATISEGLKIVSTREALWVAASEVQDWVGDQPMRIKRLEQAVRESPEGIYGRFSLGRAYRVNGEPAKCISTLQPLIAKHPDEYRACLEYAFAIEQLDKNYEKAIAVLNLSTLYGLSDPRFIATYGGMLFMLGRLSEAEKIFQQTSQREFKSIELNKIQYKPLDPATKSGFVELKGAVTVLRAGYAMIQSPGFSSFLCPSSLQRNVTLLKGKEVCFEPAFTAKGAQADRPRSI